MELWRRIHHALRYSLSLRRVECPLPILDPLGDMLSVLESSYIPVLEDEEWDSVNCKVTIPKYNPCVGMSLLMVVWPNYRMSHNLVLL